MGVLHMELINACVQTMHLDLMASLSVTAVIPSEWQLSRSPGAELRATLSPHAKQKQFLAS